MKRAGLFSVILSVITTIYTIFYMSFGNPIKNEGALSKIGLEHKVLFIIWGILTFLSLASGIAIAYKSTLKSKVHIPLLIISLTGMALTLTFDFDYDIKPDYYFHCVGSLLFSAIMGTTIFLLFLLNYKKDMIYKLFTIASGVILVGDLVLLLIFRETGLIEAVPIFAGYIMLGIVNLRREKIELKV